MEVLQKVGKAAGFLFTSCKHCTILHLQGLAAATGVQALHVCQSPHIAGRDPTCE